MMEDARLPRHVMTGRLCSAEYLDAIEPQKQKKEGTVRIMHGVLRNTDQANGAYRRRSL